MHLVIYSFFVFLVFLPDFEYIDRIELFFGRGKWFSGF